MSEATGGDRLRKHHSSESPGLDIPELHNFQRILMLLDEVARVASSIPLDFEEVSGVQVQTFRQTMIPDLVSTCRLSSK